MIVKFKYPTKDKIHWTEELAQQLIGQTFNACIGVERIGNGHIIDAVIADDGNAVNLMVEWPDDHPGHAKLLTFIGRGDTNNVSIG